MSTAVIRAWIILAGLSVAAYAGSATVASNTNSKSYYVGFGSASFPATPSSGLPAGWNLVNFDDSGWRATSFCRYPSWLNPLAMPPLSSTGAWWISTTVNCEFGDPSIPDFWLNDGRRGVYLFRKKFRAPGAITNVKATAAQASDNYAFLYVNGTLVLEPKGVIQQFRNYVPEVGPSTGPVPANLLACENILAAEVQNGGEAPVFPNGPVGLVFSLQIDYETPNVDWKAPIAKEHFKVPGNGAAPIRFALTTPDGRDIPNALGVYLAVYGPSADETWGPLVARWDLGEGPENLRFHKTYMALLQARKYPLQDGATYTAVVRDACTNDVLGSVQFTVRGGK